MPLASSVLRRWSVQNEVLDPESKNALVITFLLHPCTLQYICWTLETLVPLYTVKDSKALRSLFQ